MIDTIQMVLGAFSGALVGFTLGLVGGGGSILAVPLMVYLVGVQNPHVAIGTSALAVAVNAAMGLFNHARHGTVKWRCGFTFAAAGVVGAFAGSTAGKAFDGQRLLFLFAIVMILVGILMLRRRNVVGNEDAECNRQNAVKVLGYGLGTGSFSGFFGIGGGFLVVPGLISSTGMPILFAVGSSLVAVTAFGLTTALSYASSGLILWTLAAVFVAGGIVGSLIGTRIATRLANRKGALNLVLASLIVVVALYMLYRTAATLGWI